MPTIFCAAGGSVKCGQTLSLADDLGHNLVRERERDTKDT